MYSYIKGLIVDIQSDHIVLENNGIGYLIYVSNPYAFSKGKEVVVYLYQQVKEDGILLYGFNLKEEKDLFLKLIAVKGLGPRMALPILATGSIGGIVDAIERENILYLKKFPKIGEKLAKQIVLDLKGKIQLTGDMANASNSYEELIEVLKGLGYKEKEVKSVVVKIDGELSLEDQVKEALKLLLK